MSAHALAYSAAFHRHEDARAGRMLEVCLEHSGDVAPALREALMSDAAVFQARRRMRAEVAEQWLAAMPGTSSLAWLRLRAEAAILEARGDFGGALRALADCEKAIPALSPDVHRQVLQALRRWQSELARSSEGAAT